MDVRFEGKRALVTGAGKGIGRGLAKALVEGGAQTYALSRTQSDLDSLKNECSTIHTVCVDLADWDATRKAVQDIGAIDLLVNNAGICDLTEPFLEAKKESIEKQLNVDLKAVFNVSQIAARGMVARGKGGAIVNVSSTCSKIAVPMFATLSVAKAGLDQLTRVMALELGPHQIRVNAVNPTAVNTPALRKNLSDPDAGEVIRKMRERIPLRRFAEVKDVVDPILYLLSDKSDMINGVTLMVDGGHTIC